MRGVTRREGRQGERGDKERGETRREGRQGERGGKEGVKVQGNCAMEKGRQDDGTTKAWMKEQKRN